MKYQKDGKHSHHLDSFLSAEMSKLKLTDKRLPLCIESQH